MYPRFSSTEGGRAERAVTEVLGAILVFGLVLAVLALVQVSGIPAANEQVEFEHSQRVAGDFQSLDENVDAAATRGSLGSTGIEAGVRYPNRLFFINPGPVGGSLTSQEGLAVNLTGFSGTQADEARDYELQTGRFSTTSLRYEAGYNEYANAPDIYYENGILFERYENEDVIVDGGSLVSGRRITVVTLEGGFSTQVPDELPINVVPVSAGTRPVTVDATDAVIALRTNLSEDTWNATLSNEPRVTSVDCRTGAAADEPCDGLLEISLQDGVYELRMAKVGLTTNDNQNPAADFVEETARYLVADKTTAVSSIAGGTVETVVEVRDRFNNPVSGENVTFTIDTDSSNLVDGAASEPQILGADPSPQTGVDGQTSVFVRTSGKYSSFTVDARLDGANEAAERVSFTVTNINAGDSNNNNPDEDTLSTINDRALTVYLETIDTVDSPGPEKDNDPDTFRVTFKNQATTPQFIRQARISFHLAEEEALYADVTDIGVQKDNDSDDTYLGRLYITDEFVAVNPLKFDGDQSRTIDFTFFKANGIDPANLKTANSKADPFTVLSMRIGEQATDLSDIDNETARHTFFISPTASTDQGAFLNKSADSITTAPRTQQFSFQLDRGLPAGQSVEIDLSNVTGISYSTDEKDYQSNVNVDIEYVDTNNDETLIITATGDGLPGGAKVTVDVTGINANSNGKGTAVFTRTDVPGQESDSFGVN